MKETFHYFLRTFEQTVIESENKSFFYWELAISVKYDERLQNLIMAGPPSWRRQETEAALTHVPGLSAIDCNRLSVCNCAQQRKDKSEIDQTNNH